MTLLEIIHIERQKKLDMLFVELELAEIVSQVERNFELQAVVVRFE